MQWKLFTRLNLFKKVFSLILIMTICLFTDIIFAWNTFCSSFPSSPIGGNYLALDGKDDYAVLDFDTFGALFKDGTEDLTVEAWIYPTSEPDKDIRAIIFRQQIEFGLAGYDNPLFQEYKKHIDWKKGDLLLYMYAFTENFMGNVNTTGSIGMTLSPYQWHHIAFEFQKINTIWICDNQSKSIVQGEKIESDVSKISQISFMPDKSFVLGGYGESGSLGSFTGYIDEVRISNVARYDIGQSIPGRRFERDANTIALWHFDEATGSTTFFDSSGNDYHLIGKNGARISGPFAVDEHNKLVTTWSAIKMNKK